MTGDYMEINRDHGKKSLQDYLVNEKVPKEQRGQLMLLADGSHILWVVGKRISEYYKISKETKRVLKVQVCGGNVYE
jgi:tRNA(Ile)-lysidine synthase